MPLANNVPQNPSCLEHPAMSCGITGYVLFKDKCSRLVSRWLGANLAVVRLRKSFTSAAVHTSLESSHFMSEDLNPRHAVYVGSFDPLTLGHKHIIRRGAAIFDRITVGIGINPDKSALFTSVPVAPRIN